MYKRCIVCGKNYNLRRENCPFCLKEEVKNLVLQAKGTKEIAVLLKIAQELADRKSYDKALAILYKIKEDSEEVTAQISYTLFCIYDDQC